ncbi:hypothetical protein [Halostagnicola sp. A-GB9-2]|uniref:DUF7475 family protein n=1 Tax=Halostagnicola sp. A-GB9-2 TaxID=3048066 RepID=UPI0024C0DC7A|nr:hypothetical protein [Halostagnicola sp. A-GB9-2]MDJ1430905.1 hypothetical protein [Halostagnicola sp. A-GB9-2]
MAGMTLPGGLEVAGGTPIEWAAVALVILSGGIHLALGIAFLPEPMAVAFVLAGLGFFGALILFLLGIRRRALYLAGIPFVGAQVVIWYAFNQPSGLGDLSSGEAVDKVAQLLLIGILVVLLLRGDDGNQTNRAP